MLVVLGGLPGSGKTTVGKRVAETLAAAYIRIDALEAAMWRAGISREQPTGLAAYVVAEAIAEGCLLAGSHVVIDAVNPVEAARQAWRDLAARTDTQLRVIEVVCSDPVEHRRRVEARSVDLGRPLRPQLGRRARARVRALVGAAPRRRHERASGRLPPSDRGVPGLVGHVETAVADGRNIPCVCGRPG